MARNETAVFVLASNPGQPPTPRLAAELYRSITEEHGIDVEPSSAASDKGPFSDLENSVNPPH